MAEQHMCYECMYLSSEVDGRYKCTRPDGNGNYKTSPYVGACMDNFKSKKKEV